MYSFNATPCFNFFRFIRAAAYYLTLFFISQLSLAANLVQIENAKPGFAEWDDFYAPSNVHDMEGYANKESVNPGDSIAFYVNANPRIDANFKLAVYRLGWYGGAGARRVVTPVVIISKSQNIPASDKVTGMVQANWVKSYELIVPKTWLSGIYVVTVIGNTSKKGQYIPFVVREINRNSDYLFQVATLTWQAYNAWGGKSLYSYNSNAVPVASDTDLTDDAHIPARKVSFNRPYDDWQGLGLLTAWEIKMLFFLEREGYDVTYQTDTDSHIGNGGLLNHKALLSVGHDEYWTKSMRNNFQTAQNHGIGLGFFGANTAFWQVRLESASAPLVTQKYRTLVGYKEYAETEDPLATNVSTIDDNLVTSLWRDERWANSPENELVGIMYSFWPVNGNVITTKTDPKLANGKPSHWIYTGTGLGVGAVFKGLLGYEADRVFNNGKTPANLQIVASSSVPTNAVEYPEFASSSVSQPKAHMTVYTKPCTLTPCNNPVSTVFASGTMQWVWGLDSYLRTVNLENRLVKKITRNVLARLISAPLPK
ncbi:N,N-dimethylformamidase beta subunit family domain-containing protein [Crenothrix polyspora]|uniref:N,N-dimethylformamidase beta subunit-like C-terminal domain-containing protein n=1 Tax=Crenothrix polyspora TaxID=360316 RepID=A0A1R4H8E7_9GAMM|nr:N,N-dimethylformamidase beta subunit family domain-containing protein [Crenothrix polyspora]SJM92535.1 exported hypothetical protein [Crenothrix polyspora]